MAKKNNHWDKVARKEFDALDSDAQADWGELVHRVNRRTQ